MVEPRRQCPSNSGKATLKIGSNQECFNLASNDKENGKSYRRRDTDDEKDDEDGGLSVVYDGGD